MDDERTITFQGRIGLRGREQLQAKYPGKGVSSLQVGDILQIKQYPFDDFVQWIQVRIYEMGEGLFLLEKW